jgi:iron complex outermembrane recepter protein
MTVRSRITSRVTAGTSSFVLAAAMLAAGAGTAAAQESTPGIETVVVTAQFTEQNIQATPLAITAVTGEELTNRGIADLSDLQSSVPGLTLNKTPTAFGSGVQTYIRGIGQYDTAFASEPGVGMYIDDVYYGTLFGSSLELFDLARVEVLRGPQGVLGGKNNIGGSIRLVSQKPQGGNTGYLEIGYGTRNHIVTRGSADLTVIPERLFLRVSALSREQDGYVNLVDYVCKFGNGFGPTGGGNLPSRTTAGSDNCGLGTQGGINVRGARASMRGIITPHMDNTLSVDILRDDSEVQAGTLMVVDVGGPDVFLNRGDGIRTIPRAQFFGVNSDGVIQATGASIVTWNNAYNIPTFGIPWDQRFLADPFKTSYATYMSQRGLRYDDGAQVHAWGVNNIFEWDILENVHFKSITGWRYYKAATSNDSDVSPMSFQLTTSRPENREFQQEGRFTGTLWGDRLDWVLGAFYYDRTNTQHGPVVIDGALAPFLRFQQSDRYETESKSIYAHLIFHVTDAVNVFGGIRYTKEEKVYFFDHSGEVPGDPGTGFFRSTVDPALDCNLFAGHVPCDHSIHPELLPHISKTARPDYRLGVDWHVTEDHMLYAQYSTGYRTGGFNSRPFSPNQLDAFGPETLRSYEIGAKTDWWDHRVRVNVAAYYSQYEDIITPLAATDPDFPFLPYVKFVNLGSSTQKGFEVELTATPIKNLWLNFSYSLIDAELDPLPGAPPGWIDGCTAAGVASGKCDQVSPGTVRKGNSPILYPERTAHFDISYIVETNGWGSFTPRLDVNYQSTIFQGEDNNPYTAVEARTLLDARLTWEAPEGGWQGILSVTNLGDKQYFVNVFDLAIFNFGSVEAQPGTGREWMLTLRKSF